MKKGIIILLVIFFFTNISSSQNIRDWGFKFGVASSYQTWFYSADYFLLLKFCQDPKKILGADIGVYVEWLNNPHFSIITELRYIQKGVHDEETALLGDISNRATWRDTTLIFESRIEYLSFPILIKYRLEIGNVSPYLILGPRIDFLLHTNLDGFSFEVDKLTPTDYGLNFGCGFEYSVSRGILIGAEFQYCPSFHDVFNYGVLTVRNHSMEFLAFITF